MPVIGPALVRTVSAWGVAAQDDLARLRVLVVGAGSVGLEVALRLAATGITDVAVMDFDSVEILNLDRLIGASQIDAYLGRAKVAVAQRLMEDCATAVVPNIQAFEASVCEPDGLAIALDFDVIMSCVDRPWPRAVMNELAYTDLIPVIDGGIQIDVFKDGGIRNATWRSHVLRPGRACMACNGQINLADVAVDREGLLDDPDYIRGAAQGELARQNVAALSASVAAALLAQFVSYTVGIGGRGDPGALQFVLSTHTIDHLDHRTAVHCWFETNVGAGDERLTLVGVHEAAEVERRRRRARFNQRRVRVVALAEMLLRRAIDRLSRLASAVVRSSA